jgi:hypothetical protein
MVSQAKALASAAEKKLGDKASSEERRGIAETIKRLEEAPYRHTEKEMNKLKEMIILWNQNNEKKRKFVVDFLGMLTCH